MCVCVFSYVCVYSQMHIERSLTNNDVDLPPVEALGHLSDMFREHETRHAVGHDQRAAREEVRRYVLFT